LKKAKNKTKQNKKHKTKQKNPTPTKPNFSGIKILLILQIFGLKFSSS
jgi:hypothetical protein